MAPSLAPATVAVVIFQSSTVDQAEFAAVTGWVPKPEGLCKDVRCVPAADAVGADGRIDVRVAAQRLAMAVVEDEQHGLVALGPESGSALASAVAPELTLPDAHGNPFSLSALHGRKVLLVAWASW